MKTLNLTEKLKDNHHQLSAILDRIEQNKQNSKVKGSYPMKAYRKCLICSHEHYANHIKELNFCTCCGNNMNLYYQEVRHAKDQA